MSFNKNQSVLWGSDDEPVTVLAGPSAKDEYVIEDKEGDWFVVDGEDLKSIPATVTIVLTLETMAKLDVTVPAGVRDLITQVNSRSVNKVTKATITYEGTHNPSTEVVL